MTVIIGGNDLCTICKGTCMRTWCKGSDCTWDSKQHYHVTCLDCDYSSIEELGASEDVNSWEEDHHDPL